MIKKYINIRDYFLQMELEYFTKLERIPHKDITVFMITVLKDIPTPLQWQFTLESFREEFDRVKQ